MTNKSAFLGIDVSKGYADFILLDGEKQILEEFFALDDTRQGHSTLAKLIGQWFARGITHLYCGVESTGGYENNWFGFLCGAAGGYDESDKTLRVARINPKAVKSCGEAAMVRTQTDQTSAFAIASYLINWPHKIHYSPTGACPNDPLWMQTRQHIGFINMLVKQKTQLTNQLEKLLYQHLSELLIYCRHGIPGWLLRLLRRYPSRQGIRRAGVNKVASIRGISQNKAQSLLDKLDATRPGCSPGMARTIQQIVRQVLHLQTCIDTEEAWLVRGFEDHPDVKLLESIKGVGLASAVRLVAEIEDHSRFKNLKGFCAYFGVHPTWKESGDGIWKTGMSKKGRPGVRATLYMCALSGLRWNPDLKRLYHKFRKKGMNHYQAIGVVMHKLLRIVYGVLNSQRPYDPGIDQKNREYAEKKRGQYEQRMAQAKKQKRSKRQRFMNSPAGTAEQAPISRRAYQKRKQKASQSSLVEECAGSPPAEYLVQKQNPKMNI